MATASKLCIGIDLGTTNSCIAYYNPQTDAVEIIPNSIGERTTPSCILYTESDVLVGRLAVEASTSENHFISHVKRFIGQKEATCRHMLDTQEYQIDVDHNGYPLIPVTLNGVTKKYKPEELSSQVLYYLKQCAAEYLGQPVEEAVVTVPAYFSEAQRRATKDACTLANLKCLRLVAEPTAACLCYGLHKKNNNEVVLVYDLGGGTLDVSILKLVEGIFEVVATNGNTQLGGSDVDTLLLSWIKEKYLIQTKKTEVDIEIPLSVAENAKKALSNMKSTTIRLPGFSCLLDRTTFEELISEFVENCMQPVDNVLKDAKMTSEDISQIVLVGGSTRMPIIQTKLQQMFGANKPLNKSINPDEAVAYGAAVQASILQQVGSKCKDLLLLDVTPLSFGIETTGGIMNKIILRNSTLPSDVSKIYSTVDDYQESVEIKVFQGEREFTRDCIHLNTFTLDGLPKVPRGIPKIKVTFKLNCDGLLEVEAIDKKTGLSKTITIVQENNLQPEEINRLLKEAELFRSRDNEQKRVLEELRRFEKDLHEIQRTVNLPDNAVLLGDDLSGINQYIINTLDWIIVNNNASLEVVQQCKSTVEYNLKPYLDKMFNYMEQLKLSGLDTKVQTMEKPDVSETIEGLIQDMGLSTV